MYCGLGGAEETFRAVLGRGYLLDGSEHHVDSVGRECWVRAMRRRGSPGAPRVLRAGRREWRLTRSLGAPRGGERGADKTRTRAVVGPCSAGGERRGSRLRNPIRNDSGMC